VRHFNVYTKRALYLLTGLTVLFLILAVKLISLQAFPSSRFYDLARRQHGVEIPLPPLRGNIYDRNFNMLAASIRTYSLYANPRAMNDEERNQIAEQLSQHLGLAAEELKARLFRDNAFVWIKRKLTSQEKNAIQQIKTRGLGLRQEWRRIYPGGELAAHMLGFVDVDNQGIEGTELYYDSILSGRSGLRKTERDAMGRSIRSRDAFSIPVEDGYHLISSVDQVIQDIAEQELKRGIEESHAIQGSVIVMDPRDGSLLAVANYPTFDPNRASRYEPENRRNRVITDVYEPGSVFKIVTASAAVESKEIDLTKKVYCEKGVYQVGGRVLHDHRAHEWLSFQEVFIKSSNIGTAKIAQQLGTEGLWQAVQRFGFGRLTGIDLPGEVQGIAIAPERWSKTSILSIPMGHEVAVTPLQMTLAMSAIANDGVVMKPRTLLRVIDWQGRTVKENFPEPLRVVMRPETADQMKEILARVVEEGTGKRARIKGITVAGKTGTSQKTLENQRGYSDTDFIASFIGFLPVARPQLVVCVILDTPKPHHFGGTVCAPIFRKISESSLAYLSQRGYDPIHIASSSE
jgi:cell division protein FtsI (penicillin-binding protein 3)